MWEPEAADAGAVAVADVCDTKATEGRRQGDGLEPLSHHTTHRNKHTQNLHNNNTTYTMHMHTRTRGGNNQPQRICKYELHK